MWMRPHRWETAISARLTKLAALTDEDGALTRLYLSPAHRSAADLVIQWLREAGMSARVDSVGNVVGRYEAERPHARTLMLGSHIDTVRRAGSYDGNLGVVTAIEIVDRLRRQGRRMSFAIEVVAFGDEEGVRFPTALGGSRALAGALRSGDPRRARRGGDFPPRGARSHSGATRRA